MIHQSRFCLWALVACLTPALLAAEPAPDYEKQVAPVLKKYCAGCHNGDDLEGGWSVETFADLQKGGEHGAALLPGDSKSSRLVRMLTGKMKPQMPPKDQPQPTAADVAILTAWIDAGAKGPQGADPGRLSVVTPSIAPASDIRKAVTGLAWSHKGEFIAIARHGEIELTRGADNASVRKLGPFTGKVMSVEFSPNDDYVIAAAGLVGVFGEASLWRVADGSLVKTFSGPRDLLFAATMSADGKQIAAGGYDRTAYVWDVATGNIVQALKGHNDAIYDVAFHPSGTILASASGDQTVKLWQVATGVRLDTLSQPLKEQYAVAFSPDGNLVVAGGGDSRVRVWKLVSREKPQINPILFARFAHEGPITNLAFSRDGKTLVSVADDRTVKSFETTAFNQDYVYEQQPDTVAALAISPAGDAFLVGRINGTMQRYPLKSATPHAEAPATAASVLTLAEMGEMHATAEAEPNNSPEQSQILKLPAMVTGVIQASAGETRDADNYRIHVQAGQPWVLEINAARSKSPLDSKLEVLDMQGQPVLSQRLQAVRDSYISFRPIDSTTRDCRLQNWEEMKLNEFLYLNGEVVKLFLAPRGPDSGFSFYPHEGARRTFFDTSAMAHALGEPCYIVEPLEAGQQPVANGLPVFPLYFQNDDDGLRKWGSDSRLTFTAPADGDYVVRVTDVRGQQSDKHTYTLTVRPARPDFTLSVQGANPTINAESGKEFAVLADRQDGFEGEIRVDITGVPAGFTVTTPLVIQAGHNIARGTINALAGAVAPDAEASETLLFTATATVNGEAVSKPSGNLGEIKLAARPKVRVQVLPMDVAASQTTGLVPQDPAKPFELTIAPGETISAVVRIERNGFDGRVPFEALNQNLPHGVIIDNIGLSGLLIVEGETERTFFISAADWVPDTTRIFHLKCNEDGGQTSMPLLLHVKRRAEQAAASR